MLDLKEYLKVSNSDKISELEKEISKLKMIGLVSRHLAMYFEGIEQIEKKDFVKEVQKHSKGGCIIILKEGTGAWDKLAPFSVFTEILKLKNSLILFEALKNIWNKQSDDTKEKVSICFSGSPDDIRTVSVYWRKETQSFSTNDIADIMEEKVFS